MEIKPFKVEQWMNEYEQHAVYNIAETCVDSISLDELFALSGTDREEFLQAVTGSKLTYGHIEGSPELRRGICSLYRTLTPENVIPAHGAIGANHLVFYSLLRSSDNVVSVSPTYQQLYSIPESYGCEVRILKLRRENGFLPDLGELRTLVDGKTRLICVNNPNNPSGALMPNAMLHEIAEIAASAGAYVLCDEVYRGLNQEAVDTPSMADIYPKGISVSSMSKIFSLAGLRMGWIATADGEALRLLMEHRDYNTISCGVLDDLFSSLALESAPAILERNRRIVRNNLALLDRWVADEPLIDYVKPAAGTTALLFYDLGVDSQTFCTELFRQTGVFLTPGACFDMDRCVRIGYACAADVLEAGLKGLSGYLRSGSR